MLEEKKSIKIMTTFMKYQKLIIWCFFFSFIALFIYCLGFCTPFNDIDAENGLLTFANFTAMGGVESEFRATYGGVAGSIQSGAINVKNIFTVPFKNAVQNMNNILFIFSLIGIVLSLLLFIYRAQLRKKYYITNYIVNGICSVFSLATCIILFNCLGITYNTISNLDYRYPNMFHAVVNLKEGETLAYAEYYSAKGFSPIFTIGYVLLVLILIVNLIFICLTVCKYIVNKHNEEIKRLNAGGVDNE